jgi:hypothetical protein
MVQPLLPNGRPTLPPVALAPPAPRPYGRRVERIALIETARSPLPRAWFLPYYDPRAGVTPALRASFKLMMRHPVVKAAALTKVWSVASLDWDVKPADPTNRADQDCKDFTKHCIDRLDGGMPKLVETILLPMLIDGYQAAEKVRDVEQSEPRWRGKVVYAAVKSKPTELYDLVVDAYANVTGVEGCGPNRGADWPIEDFVFTRYLPLYGNPAGTSDFAAAYSHYWMADTVTKLRARHAEKFVDPMLWATSSADDKEETKQALRDAQGKTWMVVPAEAKVEAITLSQGGEVAYKSFLDDTDKKILIAITGAYLQALESQVQDPRGSASVSKSISELFQWVLLSIVLETVSKQMFGELTRLNFAGVRPPRLVMGGVTEEEAAKIIANLTGLQTLGYDLSKSDVARRTGYQPADPADAADKLVRPQAAANMPPGTAGPGPFGFAEGHAFAGFNPADHPRDDHGRWVSTGEVSAAKADPAKAQALRARVTEPGQRAKLDKALEGSPGAASHGPAAATGHPEIDQAVRLDGPPAQKAHAIYEAAKHYADLQLAGKGKADELIRQHMGKALEGASDAEIRATAVAIGHYPGPKDTPGKIKADLIERAADRAGARVRSQLGARPEKVRADALARLAAAGARLSEHFADVPRDEVALAGPDGKQAARLLGASKDAGARTLYYLARRAVARLLDSPNPQAAGHLFDADEYTALTDQLAKTNATANLLGRARVREKADQAEHRHRGVLTFSDDDCFCAFAEAPPPLAPTQAVDYFKSLVPSLAVEPARFGPLLRREAFTLAAKTDELMLDRVKNVIADALQTGRQSSAVPDIEDILTRAGVSPKNPQYAEMVFRTNCMESYNVGAQEELRSPDMMEMFPAWQYLGIRDGRQGKDHEPHFDHYYPNSAAFGEVRGPRVFNCRCSFRAVDKYEWADLQAKGATVQTSWPAAAVR